MNDKTLQRFLDKVDKTDHQRCKTHGCWIWTASTYNTGYGVFSLSGKLVSAHRASYEHYVGEIPDGMVVRHLCSYEEGDRENRLCVNPDHLQAGTQQENVLEGHGVSAKHAAKTHCPKCGGDYSVRKSGKRWCRPCFNAFQRERYRNRKAAI